MASELRSRAMVGRVPERALLQRRVEGVSRGEGGVVLLCGEPGIGKTRLASEAVEEARTRGCAVAVGRCRETGTPPPFWPWIQVLRGVVGEEAPAALHRRLGGGAPDVLELIGDLGGTPRPAPADSALGLSQRMRLFDSVAELLAGSGRPVVLLLDDLHRADGPSLSLLRHLAVEAWPPRLLVVATYRHTEAPQHGDFAATLAALACAPSCDEVLLGPLHRDDSRAVVNRVAGGLSAYDLATVVARAGGNPLFLQQLSRAVAGGSPVCHVPGSVREVIRHRLAHLPVCTRGPLQALSVAGREADLAVLADVSGVDRSELLGALAPAVDGGLLVAAGAGRGVRFAHALVQEVLYEALPPDRRAELHERFAQRLAGLPSPDDRILADVAGHAVSAARAGRPLDPVPALRAAAEAAARSLAFEEAGRLLGVALVESRDPAERVALLLQQGHALACGGQPLAARRRFEEGAEEAVRLGDNRALAACVLGVGACVIPVGEADWDLVALLRSALLVCPDADRPSQVRLRSRLAVELYWLDGEASRRHSALALEVAQGCDDPGALLEALYARLFTLRGPDPCPERLDVGRRLVALAAEQRSADAELRGWVFWLPELLRAADLSRYRAGVARMTRLADRSRQPLHRWYADVFRAQLATISGEGEQASTHSAAAARLARRLGIEAGEVYHLGQRVALCRDTGGVAELVSPLVGVADRFPALVTMRMLLVIVLTESGSRGEAREQLGRIAASRFSALPRDSLWLATVCYAAEAAQLLDDRVVARISAELLDPFRGTCAVQGLPVCWGAVDRALGLAWSTVGEVGRAVDCLETALCLHEGWGMRALAARTHLDLAVACSTAGPSHRSSALAHLARGRHQAVDLRLHRLAARADEIAASLTVAPGNTRRDSSLPTLSAREHDVLQLISDGSSNKQIAAELFISLNTVERHVRNIYAKLGVTNRASATALAVRAGVTSR